MSAARFGINIHAKADVFSMNFSGVAPEQIQARRPVTVASSSSSSSLATTSAAATSTPPAAAAAAGGGKKKPQQKPQEGKKAPPPAAAGGGAAAAEKKPPAVEAALAKERFATLLTVGEECIAEAELATLTAEVPNIRCYDGFEPSGRMHIAQGLFKATNVNKCTASGCTFVFWVADWFALMNDKLGGDLRSIQTVGKYLIEVWKAAGMDMERVEFQWASEEITRNAEQYWQRVLDIGRRQTVARVRKCCAIMGRAEGTLTAAQILYPLMQCADIFFLRADICQLGVDQRKVNMLAREYCDQVPAKQLGRKRKPVILSHHMLAGLQQGQAKASKSVGGSAIFMDDSVDDVRGKIMSAYCPRAPLRLGGEVPEDGAVVAADDRNPCLEFILFIIFSRPDARFAIDSSRVYTEYEPLEAAFVRGDISEDELKNALANAINALLEPVRQHFAAGEPKELLQQVLQIRGAAAAQQGQQEQGGQAQQAGGGAAATAGPRNNVFFLPCATRVPLASLASIAAQILECTSSEIEAGGGAAASQQEAPQQQAGGGQGDQPPPQMTVVLPDWSCFSDGALRGELKDIAAALEYHAEILRALLPGPALQQRVAFVKESAIIAADPNKYWITAITAGRRYTLARVEAALGGGAVEHAGRVIAPLMRCATASALGATHVYCDAAGEGVGNLISEFLSNGSGAGGSDTTTVSVGVLPAVLSPTLCDPRGSPSTPDDWLFADDTALDVRRKIKRAFCAPGDVQTPVLELAGFLMGPLGAAERQLTVERPPDNGGRKVFTSGGAVVGDFQSEALHPADLKSAVTAGMLQIAERTAAAVNTADQKKRALVLRNIEKKNAGKK